ncbi:MAG: hypothetical protein Unbinned4466contig1000_35 [Prokaryotic dsDNA virus sp.]|nr:MAG: hypothetical protein Unbinned4466contig1000_35 [Prokaryotic dsDNA virus sp.]
MKASELIYRLARAIEAKGDKEVRLAVVRNGSILDKDIEALAENMDNHGNYFEIYGEEQ